MGELQTLLRLRALLLWRWLGQHAFALFVLAPVPVAGALWVAARYLPLLRQDLAPLAPEGAWGLAFLASASLLPAALAELFPRRSADQLLDILPISEANRLHVALAGLMVRSVPLALFLTLMASFLAESASPGQLLAWAGTVLVAVWCLLPAALLLALGLAGWRQSGSVPKRWILLGVVVAFVLLALLGTSGGGAILAAPWAPSARVIAGVLGEALGQAAIPLPWGWLALVAVAPYLLCQIAVAGWRRRWLAGARGAPRGGLGSWLATGAATFLAPPLRAQVRRDLLQVLRRFSPAVGLAAGGSALLLLGAWAALGQSSIAPFDRGRLALLAGAAAVLPLSGLAPLLLARQLPRFWIERSSGLDRQMVWRAKLWSARLLALPAVLGGSLVVLSSRPASGLQLLLVLAELLVIAWILSSVLGVAAFEIAEQPVVGLVFGGLIGLAVAGFLIFYRPAWIFGVAGYLYVLSMLGDRATARVWFMEAER